METKNVKGSFDITLRGFPILFVSKSVLTSKKGEKAIIYSIHFTPFFTLGFTIKG
ncbi:MAG: hypothetical protein WC878_02925 [Candidatus Paceibacterota bacterium]|jgi:hypothetical protein